MLAGAARNRRLLSARRYSLMRIRIRSRRWTDAGTEKFHPMRVRSFILSTGIHFSGIILLLFVPSARDAIRTAAATEELRPPSRKIILYDFRRPIPNVSAPEKIGHARNPQAPDIAQRVMIATSSK